MSWGLWVIGLSTIAADGLVIIQSWVLRRTSSTAITADRTQYATDIAVNLSVLAALAVTLRTGWQRADPAFALGISGYMLWNARGIAVEALRQLMDRELEDSDRDRIRLTVLACAGVAALHDLRTRDGGDRVFIEFHLEVDGLLPVSRGHAIADAAEQAASALFPDGADVTAHIEPSGIRDERLDDRVLNRI